MGLKIGLNGLKLFQVEVGVMRNDDRSPKYEVSFWENGVRIFENGVGIVGFGDRLLDFGGGA